MGAIRGLLKHVLVMVAIATVTILLACPRPALAEQEGTLRPITLQLKWTHQFQFAGFYAAVAKGYYRDAGLDVTFKQRQPGINVTNEVMVGRADFGVGDHELLLSYYDDVPIVALGAIFQHSPHVILSRADSDINNPRDLRGKRVMLLGTTASALWAMLASQGVNKKDLTLQQLSWSTDELIYGQTDAMSAYLTDQPYDLRKRGIPYNVMRPITYGIDFYGDTLFTTQRLAKDDPELVEAFARASYRGWEYAMANPEEIIELILTSYHSRKSRAQLRYEASSMNELILPKLVEIGSMSRKRWEHIATVYKSLGMIERTPPLDDFIYVPEARRRLQTIARWTPYLTALASVVILMALVLFLFNRRLQRGIEKRTHELDRNRESLRQVIDLVPNMVYAKNRQGNFLLVNRTMAESLGMSVEELTGAHHADVHPDKEQVRQMLAEDEVVFDTGFPKVAMEEPYLHADGSTHWLQSTRLPYISADTDEPAVLTLSVDITNRRIADAALKNSEERFRAIFNQTYQFSGILNLDGTLTQINETAVEQFGVVPNDVLGKPFWETVWWSHDPEIQVWLKGAVARAVAGETIRQEVTHPLPSGEIMIVDFSIKPARNEEGTIIFLIPEGRDITSLKESEEQLRRLNEELENRVAERTRNLEEAKDELEKSLEQLKTTQEELVLSEKLAALGGLVAGVAHEINTPLGIGVTASSFLEERIRNLSDKFDTGDLKRSDLEKFIRAGAESSASILVNLGRAAELIKSFKQVAADQSSELPRNFNLKSYVDEVLLSLRPKYKRTKHVIQNTCPDIEMYSYPGAFMQIITNLLVNSLTHAYQEEDAGKIRIDGTIADDLLTFTFSDDGCGISTDLMDKIFEPFYTTKRGKGGTGLGLHIVYNTVTQTLDGSIHCDSNPGQGTKYTITMPLTRGNSSTARGEA